MKFEILTLFPQMFASPLADSILARAISEQLIEIEFHQIRDHAEDKHKRVDDEPYGGGAGMLMKYDVLYRAWEKARQASDKKAKTIYFSPQGRPLTQQLLKELNSEERFILCCGRYEGVDERFIEDCVDTEISLGDFVISGGELAAMTFMDAYSRLLPGVLGNEDSAAQDSFSNGLLEYPQYTRPFEFRGKSVPEILRSGDHAKIAEWRAEQARIRTQQKRPDLQKK